MTSNRRSGSGTSTVSVEEGPVLDDGGVEAGALLLSREGFTVRESTWAGAYYCAHVLYLSHDLAGAAASSIVRDAHGDPLVGFLHVPADQETSGAPGRTGLARHRNTADVVAYALAGFVEAIRASHNGEQQEARILLTGFGSFAAVVSNPTGDFVDDDDSVMPTLSRVTAQPVHNLDDPTQAGPRVRVLESGGVVVGRSFFDVSDAALDPAAPGSLPWAVARFQPHAILALGVHRASSIYRVEIEPTDAGLLVVPGQALKHARGREVVERRPHNRALARAIARGSVKLA